MNKFQSLKGNWIVKKRIKKNVSMRGYCIIKSLSKSSYEFTENIKTNINNKLISGYQIFKISESKKNINFYLNIGNNGKAKVYNFKKNKFYQSLYFCKKDLYLSNLKIISKNFFKIFTKIKGPKKNLSVLANYYRTI